MNIHMMLFSKPSMSHNNSVQKPCKVEGSRLTITIATHPGRELDEFDIVWKTLLDSNRLQCGVHTTQKLGQTVPYCFVEVAHAGTHLILGCGLGSPDLVSAKGGLNLCKGATVSEITASAHTLAMQNQSIQALNSAPLVEELRPALSFRPR